MAAVEGIHHAAIIVPNLERAIEFYCRALEFEPVKQSRWDAPHPLFDNLVGLQDSAASFCLLKTGNCYLEIFCYDSSCEHTPQAGNADVLGLRHLAFQVLSVADHIPQVLHFGGSIVGEHIQVKGGGAAVYCRDPFGNIIELIEPAGTMPPIPAH